MGEIDASHGSIGRGGTSGLARPRHGEGAALAVLRSTFGYETFRPHQSEIVDAVLAGRDVLAVMPTSAGKSICYQVPALVLGGLTLVVSPLISLMTDQVSALRQAGVAAACLNSALTADERREVLSQASRGELTLLYVAPERLDDPAFLSMASSHGVALLAIDEAHCISQWGNDFRPSYQRIRSFINALPTRPPVMALTATATQQVRDDIEASLSLRNPLRVLASFDRPNLSFSVERPSSRADKNAALLEFARARGERSGIVYCMSRRAVEEVCDALCEAGLAATRYHAGLSSEERERNQEDFLFDRKTIMVATNAFGMGIDKSNVSYVVHYNLPLSLENYYQEAGRAGRDGTRAECLLLYSPGDVHTAEFLLSRTQRDDLTPDQLQTMHEADEARLRQMVFYATTTDCLRSFILRYFGEEAPAYCGNCGNCLSDFEEVDERTNALKILSCVARVRQHAIATNSPATSVGAGSLVDILRGSRAAKVLERGWGSLSTYGIMSEVPVPRIRAIIDELVYREYLTRSSGDFPTIELAGRGVVFMKGDKPFIMRVAKGKPRAPKRDERRARKARNAGEETSDLTPEQAELFERLRELRLSIAREQQVPPYLIFNNATLEDMCRKRPVSAEDLLEVSGVGEKKAERYGQAFLDVIAQEA